MVSFSCEGCNETMLKKKVAGHLNRCHAPVTCIDCSNTFPGQTFKSHNQCMTEDQKYQGKMYKPKTAPKALTKQEEHQNHATQDAVSANDSPKKTPSTEKVPKVKTPQSVKVSKQTSLKKVLKQLRKEHKLDKKQVLEKVSVNTAGQLTLLP